MIVDVILIFVVVFIIYQLYVSLGHTPNTEKPSATTTFQKRKPPIITPKMQIQQHIQNFDEKAFMQGATNAFQHIVAAFTQGDLNLLKPWLESKLFQSYKTEIEQRKKSGLRYSLTFFRHISTTIVHTAVRARKVFITVRFRSEQSLVLYKNEKAIEGQQDISEILEDTWVFSHTLASKESVWFLHKTLEEENDKGSA